MAPLPKGLKVIHVIFYSLLLCFALAGAQNTNFSTNSASCASNSTIKCDKDAHSESNHIALTQDNGTYSTGYAFYPDQVRMLDQTTGKAASFSTQFTFSISIPKNATIGAEGMAFVMFANASYRGDPGGSLGVYKYLNTSNYTYFGGTEGTPTFCIEFDTYLNSGVDSSDNHVGVDLEDIFSETIGEASSVGINLKGGSKLTSWIDYNSSREILEVRIATYPNARPQAPLINYTLDLSTVVKDFMSIGFAASTGFDVEYHALYSWSFETSGLSYPPRSPKNKTALIAGVVAGVCSLLFLSCLGLCLIWFLKAGYDDSEGLLGDHFEYELGVVDRPYRFTYKQLSLATNGFSEECKLGQGGSGSVYRGVIGNTARTVVAVKRLAPNSRQGEKEFADEVSVVSRLRYRHLVKLLGWCSDHGNFLLVYELMPNGSLDQHIFDVGDNGEVLSWAQRMSIVKGVAAGLNYLHEGYTQQVVHRDIKSSNVMLDEDFNARVGDFGLARLLEHSHKMHTTQLAGTPGYIAPESYVIGESNVKTDVYSFGALTLEIACARRPIDRNAPPQEIILVDWVWACHAEDQILRAADVRLAGEFPAKEMEQILLLGLLCSHPDPSSRPSMQEVELILAGMLPLPFVPAAKPVFVYSSVDMFPTKMSCSSSSGTLQTSLPSTGSSQSWRREFCRCEVCEGRSLM